jgi:hypothetical protein
MPSALICIPERPSLRVKVMPSSCFGFACCLIHSTAKKVNFINCTGTLQNWVIEQRLGVIRDTLILSGQP